VVDAEADGGRESEDFSHLSEPSLSRRSAYGAARSLGRARRSVAEPAEHVRGADLIEEMPEEPLQPVRQGFPFLGVEVLDQPGKLPPALG
jgi:hypothetical protein